MDGAVESVADGWSGCLDDNSVLSTAAGIVRSESMDRGMLQA